MRHLIFSAFISAMIFSFPANAAKTYTPEQLRKMVESGKPPKQGTPTTQTQVMTFNVCVGKIDAIVNSIEEQYPAKNIVQTKLLYMVKVWTNDAAMTLSCSQPDKKLIITTAKYL